MTRRKSKDYIQRRHFKRRALDRYGLEIDDNRYNELVRQVQQGYFKFISRQSLRVTKWLAVYENKEFILVYDKVHKTLVTLLYPSEDLKNAELGISDD